MISSATLRTTLLSGLAITCAPAADIQSTTITDKLRDPMEIALVPNGDLIVIEREGRVLRVRPSTGGVFEIGEIPVTALREADRNSSWAREDGLLGITLDPGFAQNRRLYLYYSHPTEMLNRLSRFELKDGRLDLSSEKVLLDVATDRRDKVCHHGGSLTFGPDGLLYLSTGDNTNPFESDGFAPIDDRDGHDHANAMRSAGNTNDLRGKILRIKPTENGYEIPQGNLFPPGTAKTRPEIYVMGCRNPFRISIDPKTRVLYWGEVGPDAGNEGPKGPRGHDEVNQAKQAGNFGWPFVIADNKLYAIVDFNTGKPGEMTDPAKPKNPSVRNTGLTDLPPAQKAFIWYPYSDSPEFPTMGSGGRNAMAGPVFYYDSRRKYNILGKDDDHSLLIYDWVRSKMWKAELGRDEKLEKLEPIMDKLMHPMDMEMAADGTVWLLEYGSDWYFNKDGRIRALRPDDGNKPPTISIATSGNTYTATVSDRATIEWWLTQGVSETKVGTGTSVTLTTTGSELRAVATDAKGAIAIARVALEAEKTLPPLTLELPAKPDKLGFDEEVAFTVKGATDPSKLVVRARYIPPTGHDAGGPQFSPEIEKLVASRQCLACHQIDKTSVGPAYLDVAMKYREEPDKGLEQADVAARLQAKLKTGGGGVWGEVPMPPQVAVSDAEGETIIRAILDLAQGMAETRGTNSGKLRLAPSPGNIVTSGGAWEITAEAPGSTAARTRVPAK